jgi:hypothetical protein
MLKLRPITLTLLLLAIVAVGCTVSSDQVAIDEAVSATLVKAQPPTAASTATAIPAPTATAIPAPTATAISAPTATADVDISKRDLFNWTQLHHAAHDNSLDIATLLIDRGADIEATNNDGRTPLLQAAHDNSLEVATLLINRGADIEATNNDGYTPLRFAAWENSLEVATLLIDRGANTAGIDLSWMK